MRQAQLGRWWGLTLGVVLFLGCAGEAGPPVFPVSGTVTHKGTPLPGVAVTFVPNGDGLSAVGVTDASGKYMLTTTIKDDGAPPGKYKVTFAKYEGKPDDSTNSAVHADYDISDEYPKGYNESAQVVAPSKNVLPLKYSLPDTSGFEAEVLEKDNTFEFDLKD